MCPIISRPRPRLPLRPIRLPLRTAAGARGDDPAFDDAPFLNRALQAANDSNCELVLANKTYHIGATLHKGQGTRVYAHPGGRATEADGEGMQGVKAAGPGLMR